MVVRTSKIKMRARVYNPPQVYGSLSRIADTSKGYRSHEEEGERVKLSCKSVKLEMLIKLRDF